MITLSKENITEWLIIESYSNMHISRDKINYFEKKYGTSFSNFQNKIKNEKESYEHYDDYIEWKAYLRILRQEENRINDLKNGNIKIS